MIKWFLVGWFFWPGQSPQPVHMKDSFETPGSCQAAILELANHENTKEVIEVNDNYFKVVLAGEYEGGYYNLWCTQR